MRTIKPLLFLFSLFTLSACATHTIRVPVMVPAPVNLVNYELVAVDRFAGEGCDTFAMDLATALGSAVNPVTGKPGFAVLSRQDVDKALDQARDRRGSEIDQHTMEVLERWRKAPIVLKGTVQQHTVEQRLVEEQFKDQRGVPCVRTKQVFQASVQVEVETTDIAGNRNLDSVTLHGAAAAEVWPDQRRQTPPDPRALLASARNEIVRQYLERVLPRQVYVSVDLYKDGDVPELAVGNGYAQIGNWSSAIASYERALQGLTPETTKNKYMVLFNLGVAYEFSDRFDDARRTLEEAYALGQEQRILAELRRNEVRKGEVQRLREQGAAAAPAK